jgi:hypothetical protein
MAKPRYDIEQFVDDAVVLIKAKLAAKLTQIYDEKVTLNSDIPLPMVDDSAFYLHTWNDKILNENLALFIAIENVKATGEGPFSKEEYSVAVEVSMTRDPNSIGNVNPIKVLRYSRALKEIFEENWTNLPNATKTKIETVRPESFKLSTDSDDEVLIGGISLALSLG